MTLFSASMREFTPAMAGVTSSVINEPYTVELPSHAWPSHPQLATSTTTTNHSRQFAKQVLFYFTQVCIKISVHLIRSQVRNIWRDKNMIYVNFYFVLDQMISWPTRTLRSSTAHLLHQPYAPTSVSSHAFSVAEPSARNQLTVNTRTASTLGTFKARLKTECVLLHTPRRTVRPIQAYYNLLAYYNFSLFCLSSCQISTTRVVYWHLHTNI